MEALIYNRSFFYFDNKENKMVENMGIVGTTPEQDECVERLRPLVLNKKLESFQGKSDAQLERSFYASGLE